MSAAALACATTGVQAASATARWRGHALGAKCSLQLVGVSQAEADPIFEAVALELRRLENIFSLYEANSEISRLNRDGHLSAPSADFLSVLSTCARLNAATEGAFDPTVQPVFSAWRRALTESRVPNFDEIAEARALVGWTGVSFGSAEIRVEQSGMALTLNGIAQGYVTDRVAQLLRSQGLSNVLVEAGEVAAMGRNADGTPWNAGIADPKGNIVKRLSLANRALATSAPKGTILDDAGRYGHIFDPATGTQSSACNLISVSADHAEIADGLSTALCALEKRRHTAAISAFPGTLLEYQM